MLSFTWFWYFYKKGWELQILSKFFQFLDWALSHFGFLCLCWPIVAFKHVFRQDSPIFMHCPHVSFIDAYQVFDKMPKSHFGVVLHSNEF